MSKVAPLIRLLSQNDKAQFAQVFQRERNTASVSLQMFQLYVSGNVSAAQIAKMDLRQRDSSGKTLLFYAVAGGVSPEICGPFDALLQQQDVFGMSGLMFAAKLCRVDWLQYLIEDESGFRDAQGRSALMYAIGALGQLNGQAEGYLPLSDPEVELRLKTIDFLFDYEWWLLDNAGQTCLDYLGRTQVDSGFKTYLEGKFIGNCRAFGTPAGVLVKDPPGTRFMPPGESEAQVKQQQAGSAQITSLFQQLQKAQQETLQWKAVAAKLSQQQDTGELRSAVEELRGKLEVQADIIRQRDGQVYELQQQLMRQQKLLETVKNRAEEQVHDALFKASQVNKASAVGGEADAAWDDRPAVQVSAAPKGAPALPKDPRSAPARQVQETKASMQSGSSIDSSLNGDENYVAQKAAREALRRRIEEAVAEISE